MLDLWTRIYRLYLLLILVEGVRCQLENEDVTIGIYLDNSSLMGFKEVTEDMVKKAAETASSSMEKGSLSVRLLNNFREGESDDLFGVMAVCQCEDAREMVTSRNMMKGDKLMIAITEAGCNRIERPATITIPLVQGNNDIVQLVSDLRSKNTLIWNDIIIIVDGSVAQYHISQIVEILSRPTANSKQTSVVIMNISDFGSTSTSLDQLFDELGPRPGEPRKRQFLVIVSQDNVDNVQKIAKSTKLIGPNFQWLFVIPDTNSDNFDMEKYLTNTVDGDNIAYAYNMSISNPTTSCNNGYDCILEEMLSSIAQQMSATLVNELELFNQVSEEEWDEIKPTQQERATTIITAIEQQLDTLPTCAVCNQWGIKAVEIKGPTTFKLIDVADWRPGGGSILFDDIFPHITGGFRKRVIFVTSVHFPPFQKFIKTNNGTIYSGLIFRVLDEIGKMLNYTYEVKPPPDGLWGVKDDKGNYNGMIKVVQDKEVLLGAAAFSVSDERMEVINFTMTIDREPYTYMIARPQELSRVLIFIEPFANETWVWIGLTVLFMGPILYIIHSASPYYDYHGTRDKKGLFNILNCAWYVFGAILQQGGSPLPNANSGRLLVSFWWIWVTVIVTTYTGNLVAFLTFPQLENSVSTLQDLLDTRGMTWGYVDGTVLSDYFKTAEGKYQEVGEEAIIHERQSNELLEKVRLDNHAYIEWKTVLLDVMHREFNRTNICDYSLGREEFYFENMAMILPQDSPYKPLFDNEIKRMLESGLMMKWKVDFWPRANKCSDTAYGADISMRTVSMSDMQGSFILLIIGFLLGLAIIITECFIRLFKVISRRRSASSMETEVKSLQA